MIELAATLAIGESLDWTIAAPVAGANPLGDGSLFVVAFALARDSDEAVLLLSSANSSATPRIEAVSYADPDVTLTLRASASRIAQIAPGVYVGDLIRERPRAGVLGAMRTRIAVVTLTIVGGTGS